MPSIPDITDAEQWAVETTLKQRWKDKDIDIQLAHVDIRMHPHERELTECPAIVWEVDGTSFVIIKTDDRNYRSQFYYRGYQQYGTGKTDYDDITDCVVTLLQVHADKEATDREQI